VAEGDKNAPLKNLPSPFPGFGPRDSSEQEQVPFPPSPAVPEESAEGHDDDEEEEEVEVEGDIVVEIEEEGEEGDFNSRSSEEPPLFSGRASNSLSSLVQPIPSCYPVRIPTSGSDSPPFAFWRATATPQSKSTPTRESHETRCTGDVMSATASCLLAQVTPDLALSKGVGGRPHQRLGRGGMGMPRTSCGLGADDVGETAETGKPAKGDGSYCYKATIDVRGTP